MDFEKHFLIALFSAGLTIPMVAGAELVSSGNLFPSTLDALARNPSTLAETEPNVSAGGGYSVLLGNADIHAAAGMPIAQDVMGSGFSLRYTPVSHSYGIEGGVGVSTKKWTSPTLTLGFGASGRVAKTLNNTTYHGDLAARLRAGSALVPLSASLALNDWSVTELRSLEAAVGAGGMPANWSGELGLSYGFFSRKAWLKPGGKIGFWGNRFSLAGGFSVPLGLWRSLHGWGEAGFQLGSNFGAVLKFDGQFTTASAEVAFLF